MSTLIWLVTQWDYDMDVISAYESFADAEAQAATRRNWGVMGGVMLWKPGEDKIGPPAPPVVLTPGRTSVFPSLAASSFPPLRLISGSMGLPPSAA